jgi:hypothetical protein
LHSRNCLRDLEAVPAVADQEVIVPKSLSIQGIQILAAVELADLE